MRLTSREVTILVGDFTVEPTFPECMTSSKWWSGDVRQWRLEQPDDHPNVKLYSAAAVILKQFANPY